MSTFQVVPAEMGAAAGDVTDAGADAKGRGSSGHLGTAAGAIRGGAAAPLLGELGSSWDDEVDAWAADAQAFADDVAAASSDAQGADQQGEGLFGGLGGLLGGGGDN